jgi:hypothetical protein
MVGKEANFIDIRAAAALDQLAAPGWPTQEGSRNVAPPDTRNVIVRHHIDRAW